MQLTPLKTVIAAVWLVAIAALAVALPVNTISGWAAIVGLGLLPLVLMLRAWNQPAQTMSEVIQEARRK
jgi:hypothetical protein